MKRTYKDGVPHHVYNKGLNGNIIFYSKEDCILYLSLYSVLSRKYGIKTYSFSIMPNHTHSLQKSISKRHFIIFNQELNSSFTYWYNEWHNRRGALLHSPFGSAPKSVGKLIRNSISYINNNAQVGHLSDSILNYKWDLMAYRNSSHPFSRKIVLSEASAPLRRSKQRVDYFWNHGKPLYCQVQEWLTKGLNIVESGQLTDYIISRYNPLDYSGIDTYFGSFDKAMLAMEANGGSEHDIKEDWDDYSVYPEFSRLIIKLGYSLSRINFETMPSEKIEGLAGYLRANTAATYRQIDKYLHISRGG